jgi:hypothetical protein
MNSKIIIVVMAMLLWGASSPGQGIVYLTTFGNATSGNHLVGSNSWEAGEIKTGTNSAGYTLNAVQLLLAGAVGNPGSFSVFLYTNINSTSALLPGGFYAALSGSNSPATAGIYTFTTTGNVILTPATPYYVVVTSQSGISTGTYQWNYASGSTPFQNEMWAIGTTYNSTDGQSWHVSGNFFQLAVNATPITASPEPTVITLCALGGGLLLARRFRVKR